MASVVAITLHLPTMAAYNNIHEKLLLALSLPGLPRCAHFNYAWAKNIPPTRNYNADRVLAPRLALSSVIIVANISVPHLQWQ